MALKSEIVVGKKEGDVKKIAAELKKELNISTYSYERIAKHIFQLYACDIDRLAQLDAKTNGKISKIIMDVEKDFRERNDSIQEAVSNGERILERAKTGNIRIEDQTRLKTLANMYINEEIKTREANKNIAQVLEEMKPKGSSKTPSKIDTDVSKPTEKAEKSEGLGYIQFLEAMGAIQAVSWLKDPKVRTAIAETAISIWTSTKGIRMGMGRAGMGALTAAEWIALITIAVPTVTTLVVGYAAAMLAIEAPILTATGASIGGVEWYRWYEGRSQKEHDYALRMSKELKTLAETTLKYEFSKVKLHNIGQGLTFDSYRIRFKNLQVAGGTEGIKKLAGDIATLMDRVPERSRGDLAAVLAIDEQHYSSTAYSENNLAGTKGYLERYLGISKPGRVGKPNRPAVE